MTPAHWDVYWCLEVRTAAKSWAPVCFRSSEIDRSTKAVM